MGTSQALLNDVGAELVAGQLTDAALEHDHYRLGECGFVEVDNVLNHIITERILDEDSRVLGNTLDEPELLVPRSVIDAAL